METNGAMTYVFELSACSELHEDLINPVQKQYLDRLKFTNDIKDFRYITDSVRPVLLIEV